MTSQNLENLAKAGHLKQEPGDQREFDGLVRSARARLNDAHNDRLSIESRFDLAYNAAHALALAALRWHGYRSDRRYTVFQCVPHTLGLGPEVWRVLALCRDRRNLTEYEGHLEIDEQLVARSGRGRRSFGGQSGGIGTAEMNTAGIVQKLWNYCNVLRDDGMSFSDVRGHVLKWQFFN